MPLRLSRRRFIAVRTALLAGLIVLGADARADSRVRDIPKGVPLYVECRGRPSASPTVILESGLFGAAPDWDWVLDDLAKGGRVCAYDRSGLGLSPPKSGMQDVDSVARGLADLLDAMGETAPVILAGHSNGALYAEAFAARWPRRVAGLLYINGVNSDDLDYPILVHDMEAENRLANLVVTAGSMGLAPVIAYFVTDASDLRGKAAAKKRRAMGQLAQLKVGRDEDLAMIAGMSSVRALGGSPTDVPTAVIVGAVNPRSEISKAWRSAGAAIVQRARTGWLLTADGASHTSPLARDRAYVDAAVGWLRTVHAARASAAASPAP